MRAERREKRHRHVALVATATAPVTVAEKIDAEFNRPAISGISLLRLSVPARLFIVAVTSALLWGAVLWALA